MAWLSIKYKDTGFDLRKSIDAIVLRSEHDKPIICPFQEDLCYSLEGRRLQPHPVQTSQRSSRSLQLGHKQMGRIAESCDEQLSPCQSSRFNPRVSSQSYHIHDSPSHPQVRYHAQLTFILTKLPEDVVTSPFPFNLP